MLMYRKRYLQLKNLEPMVPRFHTRFDEQIIKVHELYNTGEYNELELLEKFDEPYDEYTQIIHDSHKNKERGFYIMYKYLYKGKPEEVSVKNKLYRYIFDALDGASKMLYKALSKYYNFTLEEYKEKQLQLARGEFVQIKPDFEITVRHTGITDI